MKKHLNRKSSCISGKDMTIIEIDTLIVKEKFAAKINPDLILYECLCGYKTNKKHAIKKHLNRKDSCIPEKDMSSINANTLLVKGKIRRTNLTEEEKKENTLKQCINNTSYRKLGTMSIENFAKYLFGNMKNCSLQRNHEEPGFTVESITKLLEENNSYTVQDTILGSLTFPLQLTNGYHNSASFDRIDNNLGYFEENIEIRPFFLNTQHKLTSQDIKKLVEIREIKQDEQKLVKIAKYINRYTSKHFFYNLAYGMKNSSERRNKTNKDRNITFDFESVKKCAMFLIKKYIEQGGRCAYSYIPMCLELNNSFKASPERLDPTKGYTKDNTVLIAVGLNGKLAGQYLNPHLTDEERQIALESGKFNQEYWDTCTKIIPEIRSKCEEVREYEKRILFDNLSKKIMDIING